jgi:hypothetical protein
MTVLLLPLPALTQESKTTAPTVVYSSVGVSTLGERVPGALHVSIGRTIEACHEAIRQNPALAAQLLEAWGLEAINLAAPDLSVGAAALLSFASQCKVPIVSSNVFLTGTKRHVGKPYVILGSPEWKVGVIGVTSPAREPLKDLEVADAVESLKEILPAMEKEVHVILLLAWMDRLSIKTILDRYPSIQICVQTGHGVMDPDPIQIGTAHLLQGPVTEGSFTRSTILWGEKKSIQHQFEVSSTVTPKDLVELARKCKLPPYQGEELFDKEIPKVLHEDSSRLPSRLHLNKAEWLNWVQSNRAVKVTTHSVCLRDEYGPSKPSEGHVFLVVDTEWENIIPLPLVYDRQLPIECKMANVRDHVYAIVNGSQTAMVHPQAEQLAGHIPVKDFSLDRIGSKLRGNLLFEVPTEELESLEIRFYDFHHGHIRFQLLEKTPAEAKPIVPLQENEVLEAGVYGLRQSREWGGRTAPTGMTYLLVDFRARSRFTLPVDATAFDSKAQPGDQIDVGTVADWHEARRYLQAIVDGRYAYLSSFPEEPRFLPDIPTGERAVFLVPEKYASLELRCDIPNAQTSEGEEFHPQPLVFELEGTRPEFPDSEPLAEVTDGGLEIRILSQSTAHEFAGAKPGEQSKFLILDLQVKNVGEGGEFFQTREQLKYLVGEETTAIHEASFQGMHPPAELVWIPSYEVRAFQLVYEIPRTAKDHRLSFAGTTLAETLELKTGK